MNYMAYLNMPTNQALRTYLSLQQFAFWLAEFEKLNPLHYVPVLVDGDVVVSDSYAIILVCNFIQRNARVFVYLLLDAENSKMVKT